MYNISKVSCCHALSALAAYLFRFLGLRKASALGYHESQLRSCSPQAVTPITPTRPYAHTPIRPYAHTPTRHSLHSELKLEFPAEIRAGVLHPELEVS
jgi:hypothetical protein